ncbi:MULTISPECIES: hypothetical protein [unclassified Micromonospora]|uniref:hypothetical protein n=1 Tax=unclassified Micromonospora TaxID=2617518 RepID=UPI001183326F|nr:MULTISPECIES: hypothetical protein [unclassified Micromonospora]MDI5936871.1 hypothetical protein [Micromonospora sp. DH15]
MAENDLGILVLGAILGTIGNYAAAETVNLRRALQRRPSTADALALLDDDLDDGAAQRRLQAVINREARNDVAFAVELSDIVNGTVRPIDMSRTHAERGSQVIGSVDGEGHLIVGPKGKVQIGGRTYSFGGFFAVLVAAAGIIFWGGYLTGQPSSGNGGDEPTLTSSSTCVEFMAAPPEARDDAVRRLAVELNQTLNTFALLNVESTCSGAAGSQTLGDAVKKALPPSD